MTSFCLTKVETMAKIEAQILTLLADDKARTFAEIERAIEDNHDAIMVRRAIWHLISQGQAELAELLHVRKRSAA